MSSYSPTFGTSYAQINAKPTLRKRIARLFSRSMSLADRELMNTLVSGAVGDTASAQHHRVAHATELGGVRTVESVDLVNRVTVSGDVTDLVAGYLAYDSTPTYPTDKATLGV